MAGPNPFTGDVFSDAPGPDPIGRLRSAVTKLRSLRTQVGHDGLTPSASRALLEELTTALDACAQALEELDSE
jgi:hypothetical protein